MVQHINILGIKSSKKGISPVVATALLLVVAVVSAVVFQNWYGFFQSDLVADIEQDSSLNDIPRIETIIGGNLYIKGEVEIQNVMVNSNDCFVSGLTDIGLNNLPIANCARNGINEVVIVTNNGVYSQTLALNSYTYSEPCPHGYIMVPGNIELGTKNFCVMKYEAKNVSGIALSQASGLPWVSLTWQQAKANCEGLGSGYHLITDDEWLTIAKNIEQQWQNWNSSVVGTGFIYLGHNDNNPTNSLAADTNDSNGYYGTNDGVVSPGDGSFTNFPSNDARAYQGQKRTLTLSNGEVIWDLSGNVWEWVNDSISAASRYHGGDQDWLSYNSDDGIGKIASQVPVFKIPSNGWNAINGMGRYHDGSSLLGAYNTIIEAPDICTGFCSPIAVFRRGGYWVNGAATGIFALHLYHGPSAMNAAIGFRCAYSP